MSMSKLSISPLDGANTKVLNVASVEQSGGNEQKALIILFIGYNLNNPGKQQ